METSSILSSYASTAAQAVNNAGATRRSSAQSTTATSSGDKVTISDAAKEFSKYMAKSRGDSVADDTESQDPIEKLKKKIEELEKKIAQVEQSSVPEATKEGAVRGMETELASLRQQLSQLMAEATQSKTAGAGSASASKGKA